MKASLRTRYTAWVALLLMVFVGIQWLTLFAFEVHEWRHDKHFDREEELQELALFISVSLLGLPLMLVVIWGVSRPMLRPLTRIAHTAERIRAGRLQERVPIENPDDELGVMAGVLNQAFDRYEDAMDRLRRFSADASHQLRTPLAAIRSVGEVSLQRPRTAAEYRETIADILEEVQKLTHATEQLLLLARIELPEWTAKFRVVDLADIARGVCSRYEPFCADRGQALTSPSGDAASVMGDAALLEQVVANLVDNAVKFTPPGGRIAVDLVRARDGRVLLRVSDNGPGVPPEIRDRIFHRFTRASLSEASGTGLGLAIVAEIVKVHGGAVRLDSGPGRGAVFEVTLPAASV